MTISLRVAWLLVLTAVPAAAGLDIERVETIDGPFQGTVNAIVEDRTGFIWLGTTNGLVRYDGYSFRPFRYSPTDSNTISGNHVWSLCEDRSGSLWIGTSGRGLSRLVFSEHRFTRYRHDPRDENSLAGNWEVPWVFEDRSGTIWVALWERGLDRYLPQSDGFLHRSITTLDAEGTPRGSVHRIAQDGSGRLWIGTRRGLFRLDRPDGDLVSYRYDATNPRSLGGDYVFAIVCDRSGRLWVGSNGGGVSRYRADTDDFDVFKHDARDPASLPTDGVVAMCADSTGWLWIGTEGEGLVRMHPESGRCERVAPDERALETVVSLYTDGNGIVWIGTAGSGLYRHHPSKRKFQHVRHDPDHPNGLSSPHVTAVHEARDGSLWVGTVNAGLNHARVGSATFTHYRHEVRDRHSVGSDNITAIAEGADGILWIGTYGGGLSRRDPATGRFQRFVHDPADTTSLADDRVVSLAIDRRGRLWVGTDGSGTTVFDPASGRFDNRAQRAGDSLRDLRHVFTLLETTSGAMWVGSWGVGAACVDLATGATTGYRNDPTDPASIGSDIVVSLAEGASGATWLGTWSEGLDRFDPGTQTFEHFTSADGLPGDVIFGIVVDETDAVWVSTSEGLARRDPETKRWRAYDVHDGLQSPEFVRGAYHRGRSGRIYFGGINGLNVFTPGEVLDNPHAPPIVLTSFRIRDREVTLPPLSPDPATTPRLALSHRENAISVEFAALDYAHAARNRYAYRLEGADEEWVQSGTRRFASYSHLRPGAYTLRVKGSNQDGVWNEDGVALSLIITPPPWRTWWAYTLYTLFAMATVFTLRQREMKRIRLAHELRVQRIEADKLRELDQAKSRFFANISHEFRTPLTLILGPLERLKESRAAAPAVADVEMMRRNALRLSHMIDQVLDLSKIESASFALNLRQTDVREIARVCAASFTPLAGSHGLDLRLDVPAHSVLARIDAEQIEKCLNNLLSNAVKFTPAGGNVSVRVRAESDASGRSWAILRVADTGVGIPPEAVERVFDRFFQIDDERQPSRRGTGIGLSLTRELVSLHGGTISVESTLGAGAAFTVRLPLAAGDEVAERAGAERLVSEAASAAPAEREREAPLVLVVEDDDDMRAYVRGVLTEVARVVEATGGELGVRMSVEHAPDAVVCDVMMAGVDGFEACRRIKTDPRTSHIPVVMLTARAGEESRLEGLETGADDYIAKPFSAAELRVRVRNLIESRRKLRERFGREVTLMPADIAITPVDANFVERLMAIVNDNLGEPDFNVEAFAREVGMSRMHLHRKIRALTGQSTGEFLRTVRLRQAARLLREGGHTVTEVAYAVGFQTPTYFTKCFREDYGVTPSEYTARGPSDLT
jgi:signal transduction histidine kinase/ligand-binding sensor domain-containing protein/CheY-like chemotaxis protein